MLVTIRKHAGIIAGTLVGAMVITLFAGSLFMGKYKLASPPKPADAIATVGDIVVSQSQYEQALSQLAARYRINSSQKQDPEFLELLQYTAFEQTLQTSILVSAAKTAGLKVSGRDFDGAIQGILVQYDIKDLDQLKTKLKDAHYEWDEFEENIKNNILAQMYANYLQGSVKVTQQDLENQNKSIHVRQILIRVAPGDKSADEVAKKKADKLYLDLKSGTSFASIAASNSDDFQTRDKGGDLGWVTYGTTVGEFENVMYALDKGELSHPFRTPFGYHIIQVIDQKQTGSTSSLSTDAAKADLLKIKQTNAVSNYIRGIVSQSKLDITNPSIRAYYSKSTGNDTDAIGAYQRLESMNTYDPRPHYLAGLLYQKNKQSDLALTEFQRAVLKGQLQPQADIPMAHVELGKIFGKTGKIASQNSEYDRAIESAKGHLIMLKILEKQFKELGETRRSSITGALAMTIESALKQAAATQNAGPQSTQSPSTLKI